MKTSRIISGLGLIVVLLLAGGCQQQTPAATFVAEIPNAGAAIGLAIAEGKVIAYLCDGVRLGEWFRGDASGSSVDLTSASGIRLKAEIDGDQASGTLTLPDGQAFPFTAEAASGEAGFYRAESSIDGADVVGGWILLPDGRQVGTIGGFGGGIGGLGGQLGGIGGIGGGLNSGIGGIGDAGSIGGLGGQTLGGVQTGGIGGGLNGGIGDAGGIGGIGGIGGGVPFDGEPPAQGDQATGTTGESSAAGGSDGSTTGGQPGASDGGAAPTLTPEGAAAPIQTLVVPAPPFDPQIGTVETPFGVLTPTPCQSLLGGG